MKNFQKYITEGGNAVSGVVPITQANAKATIEFLKKNLLKSKLKLKDGDYAILGSAGKKRADQTSGDIDIGIDIKALVKQLHDKSLNSIFDFIKDVCQRVAKNVHDSRGLGIISMEYPIVNADGTQKNEYVQIDLMVVDDISYASWAFYSPSYHMSKYKGVYRNFLFAIVAKYADMKSSKNERERYAMTPNTGLIRIKQTLVGKTGKPLAKAKTIEKALISKDPYEIVQFLFGDKYTPSDVLSFEQTLKIILSSDFKYKAKRKQIIDDFKVFCNNNGLPVPEEVEKL